MPPPYLPPNEMFDNDEGEEIVIAERPKERKNIPPQQRFDELVNLFYTSNSYMTTLHNVYNELEVKFGTKGIKSLTKSDYDNVVKKLKSFGFNIKGENSGAYYLRINCEFLDSTTGKFKMSNIRSEVAGLFNIQEYCKTNNIKNLPQPQLVEFITKKPAITNKQRVQHVDFDDFNFRVTLNTEEKVNKMGIKNYIIENWRKSKKEFRFINRVTLEHTEFPFVVDLSIVKSGNKGPDRFGNENRGPIIRVYTLEDSNVLNNPETYEIEIELINSMVGPGTKFNSSKAILESLRKLIKYVLGGLHGTNFPISYLEQKSVLESYMKMIWKDEYDPKKYVGTKHFIGPNSITLQLVNIAQVDDNFNEPNIRKDFVVTDKADGDRHMLFIADNGKIYLINTSMDVIFTGAKTTNEECFNTLLDGELIMHDKKGNYINLYAILLFYNYN
jgi:hypothetical protein